MNVRLTILSALSLIALLTTSQFVPQAVKANGTNRSEPSTPIGRRASRTPVPVPGRFIVKYRSGYSISNRKNLMTGAGVRIEREIPGLATNIVQIPEGVDSEAYRQFLRSRPEIESIEPDYLIYPAEDFIPDDPMYSSQWHLPNVNCPSAWGMTTGSDQVIIALCDTGIDSAHPDLASKLVPGWNIVDNNSDTRPVSPHGTWTAGTAAAAGNNSIGVASPALDCKIMPVRVSSLSSGAAMLSDLAAGVVWAADHGARIASVSYMAAAGGTNTMSDAGKYIESKGGVLVVAAGNTSTYFDTPDSPDIIVVSATAPGDSLAGFTTTGTYVDVSAPGSSILTTSPGNAYQFVNGTSFSTPLVSGAVGLMMSLNPKLTPSQIDSILKISADDLGPAGWDSGYGWGRINIARALEICQAFLTGAPDSAPPAVGFQQPQMGGPSNALIGNSKSEIVKVKALDDHSVASVSLSVDGVYIGAVSSEPYTFYIDGSSFVPGSQHNLTVTAFDETGNRRTVSTEVTVSSSYDATPPTASFVQPQTENGLGTVKQSSNATILIDAQDNRMVTQVSLVIDGAMVGSTTSAPYAFTWDTSTLAAGSSHVLTALAGDAGNNWAEASITVSIISSVDRTPPLTSFQQPQSGSSVSQSTSELIAVNASDDMGVASVSLYADGKEIGSLISPPYQLYWDTSRLTPGSSHSLRAVAFDKTGNSSNVSILVSIRDDIAPSVSFKEPDDGERISGNKNVSINASDNGVLKVVELFIDGQFAASWARGPFNTKWNTSKVSKGLHTLKCVAYDGAGNSASSTISVTVK